MMIWVDFIVYMMKRRFAVVVVVMYGEDNLALSKLELVVELSPECALRRVLKDDVDCCIKIRVKIDIVMGVVKEQFHRRHIYWSVSLFILLA